MILVDPFGGHMKCLNRGAPCCLTCREISLVAGPKCMPPATMERDGSSSCRQLPVVVATLLTCVGRHYPNLLGPQVWYVGLFLLFLYYNNNQVFCCTHSFAYCWIILCIYIFPYMLCDSDWCLPDCLILHLNACWQQVPKLLARMIMVASDYGLSEACSWAPLLMAHYAPSAITFRGQFSSFHNWYFSPAWLRLYQFMF